MEGGKSKTDVTVTSRHVSYIILNNDHRPTTGHLLIFFFASESWPLEAVSWMPGAVRLLVKWWVIKAHDLMSYTAALIFD
jgi:hypothetical protein